MTKILKRGVYGASQGPHKLSSKKRKIIGYIQKSCELFQDTILLLPTLLFYVAPYFINSDFFF